MKNSRLTTAIFVLGLIAIGMFFWRSGPAVPSPPGEKQESVARSPALSQPASANQSLASGSTAAPRLFKALRYPPETPEEKAMWDWWNRMEKTDPQFQWKMPIEFYGKVVDQFGQPVVNATVVLNWTAVGGGKELRQTTGSDGKFALTGENGKRMTVDIMRQGYLPTRQSFQSFEYAEFFNELFHVPDLNQPVVFRMQKLMGTEPFYVYPFNGKTTPDGSALWLNVEQGTFARTGDLSFAVSLGQEKNRIGPEYVVIVQAWNGAMLMPTSEEFPFLAPEEGYQSTLRLPQWASDSNYQKQTNLKFYVKLPGGRYAFVGVEVNVIPGGDVVLNGAVRYNEKWSKNLEFDHGKWINR